MSPTGAQDMPVGAFFCELDGSAATGATLSYFPRRPALSEVR